MRYAKRQRNDWFGKTDFKKAVARAKGEPAVNFNATLTEKEIAFLSDAEKNNPGTLDAMIAELQRTKILVAGEKKAAAPVKKKAAAPVKKAKGKAGKK